MFHYDEQGGEAKAVGWISMSDLFMLCSIVMLAVAVCFAMGKKETDSLLSSTESQYAKARDENAQTLDAIKSKAAQLAQEAAAYKSRAADLDPQVANLKVKVTDAEMQLARFKDDAVKYKRDAAKYMDEAAKFKAQSETLIGELSLQSTKLNSVQNDFDAARNASARAIGELKSEIARLSKQVADDKSAAASLQLQASALEQKLAAAEKDAVALKTDRNKFKTDSENLAGELDKQRAKFEGELAKANAELARLADEKSKTSGDLSKTSSELAKAADKLTAASIALANANAQLTSANAELSTVRAEKDQFAASLDTAKTDIAVLQRSDKDLKKKLTAADADAIKMEERIAALARQKSALEKDLADANDKLTLANRDLSKANAEKDRIIIDLNALKAGDAALLKDEAEMKRMLALAETERKNLVDKLTATQVIIMGLNKEIGELKPAVGKLKIDLDTANMRIIDLQKAVFEKVNRAKLVITVTAQDVPKDFTLELFVTDPLANECGPFSSVIFNDGDEIGVLQQSVDFKSGKEGSQTAVFYSLRPIGSNAGTGQYSVRTMLRHNGNDEKAQLPRHVMVTCSIDLPEGTGPEAHKTAQREIDAPGYIRKVKRTTPLTANTPYKAMWPWEPAYHFERVVCDFRIDGDRITNLTTYDKLSATAVGGNAAPTGSGAQEQRIDSIRTRGGN